MCSFAGKNVVGIVPIICQLGLMIWILILSETLLASLSFCGSPAKSGGAKQKVE